MECMKLSPRAKCSEPAWQKQNPACRRSGVGGGGIGGGEGRFVKSSVAAEAEARQGRKKQSFPLPSQSLEKK